MKILEALMRIYSVLFLVATHIVGIYLISTSFEQLQHCTVDRVFAFIAALVIFCIGELLFLVPTLFVLAVSAVASGAMVVMPFINGACYIAYLCGSEHYSYYSEVRAINALYVVLCVPLGCLNLYASYKNYKTVSRVAGFD